MRATNNAAQMYADTADPAAVATETKMNVERLDVYYGAFRAIKRRVAQSTGQSRHGAHRPVGLR